MGFFGPNEEEISWKRFAAEVGGTFHRTGGSRPSVLVYVEPWTIELDTFVSAPPLIGIFTVMRAPYISDDGLTLKIYPYSFTRFLYKLTVGKLFGMQNIEVGDPEFDREFIIMAKETSKTEALLGNTKIRQLIQSVMPRSGSLEAVSQDPVWLPRTRPEWTQCLVYKEKDIITDVERLESILELLTVALHEMCKIGSASRIPPSE